VVDGTRADPLALLADIPALPLAGIRVVDATANIAGPFGGSVLADLGADVCKVEAPGGDSARRMAPVEPERDTSAYFHVVNRNKSAITVDLRTDEGQAVLAGLLDDADVFLTNLLPRQLVDLHLTAAEVRAQRPRLIVGHLSAYGSRGPERDRPGFDAVLQARTGIAAVTGQADGPPVRAGISVLDVGSGMWLAIGVLAALYRRERTGIGGLVETSLLETGAAWVGYHLSAYQATGEASGRHGSGHPAFSPYGIFPTGDGDLCIGVGNDALFARLCAGIGRPDLLADPRFATNTDRVAHDGDLRTEMTRTLAGAPASIWAERLAAVGVPADRVSAPEDLLTDPQATAMGVLLDYPDPRSPRRLAGLPLSFDGERPGIRTAAPDLA